MMFKSFGTLATGKVDAALMEFLVAHSRQC
jgi:hypothetical protein